MPSTPPWISLLIGLGYLFTLGNTAYTWLMARQKDHGNEIAALRQEFGDGLAKLEKEIGEVISPMVAEVARNKERIATLEQALQHLPDQDSMHSLAVQLERLTGQLNALSGRLEYVDRVVQRVDSFLLEHGSRA